MLELPLPWPARVVNAAGRALRRHGQELVEFDVPLLLEEARQQARADDFGEPDFMPALRVLVESAERDANLSLLGRSGLRDAIVTSLAQRLLRVHRRLTHPNGSATTLVPPLIVIGLPRSGTTLLHRLLALAPEARALRYWELRRPLPPPGHDDRRAWAGSQQRAFKWLARGLDAKHFSGPEAPEECLFLFDSTLVSVTFWIAAPVFGYLDWYLAQDQRAPYRTYRELLELFQAETPERRLTLKAPVHTAHVPALRAAVPEAHLVQLHRDPRPALASMNSLFATLHRVVTERVDLGRMGHANLNFAATGMERLLDTRAGLPDGTIFDVYYAELVADPVGTVRAVRRHFDLSFDAEYEARLVAFMRENPQHRHGAHRYDARDFGLDDEQILGRFERYLERFPRARAR